MINDLLRLVQLGVITIDKIVDTTIKAEVQAKLTA